MAVPSEKLIEKEVGRRRGFAIISHPDAGKATWTESGERGLPGLSLGNEVSRYWFRFFNALLSQ